MKQRLALLALAVAILSGSIAAAPVAQTPRWCTSCGA